MIGLLASPHITRLVQVVGSCRCRWGCLLLGCASASLHGTVRACFLLLVHLLHECSLAAPCAMRVALCTLTWGSEERRATSDVQEASQKSRSRRIQILIGSYCCRVVAPKQFLTNLKPPHRSSPRRLVLLLAFLFIASPLIASSLTFAASRPTHLRSQPTGQASHQLNAAPAASLPRPLLPPLSHPQLLPPPTQLISTNPP
jgi:hypothetical protein